MICDECETVAHCLKNGCVPKQPSKDEVLKLALYALEIEDAACRYMKDETPSQIVEAITAIKQALSDAPHLYETASLAAPAPEDRRSAWVGLTPDDIRQLEKENTVGGLHGDYCPTWDLIESVEAKLKEKNSD
jgi:hypothetical protein